MGMWTTLPALLDLEWCSWPGQTIPRIRRCPFHLNLTNNILSGYSKQVHGSWVFALSLHVIVSRAPFPLGA